MALLDSGVSAPLIPPVASIPSLVSDPVIAVPTSDASFHLHTHPIQAAQVLDFVLVSRSVIVDDSMLLIHTARLQTHRHMVGSVIKTWINTYYVKVCLEEEMVLSETFVKVCAVNVRN